MQCWARCMWVFGSKPVVPPRGVVWVLMFVLSFWRVMCHIPVAGYLHTLTTPSLDTVIFTMRPSYKLTSLLMHMDMYPASWNLPRLTRGLSARSGTMSRTLGWSLDTFDPSEECPYASANIFFDGSSLWMNGSPVFPALDVYAVSHSAASMVSSSTPFFKCCSVGRFDGDVSCYQQG